MHKYGDMKAQEGDMLFGRQELDYLGRVPLYSTEYTCIVMPSVRYGGYPLHTIMGYRDLTFSSRKVQL